MVTPRKRVSAVWEFFNEAIVVEVKDGKHVKISCKLCDQQLKWWWWHYQNLLSKHPEEHKRIVPSNTTTTKQDILKGFFPNFLLNMPLQSVTFAEFVAKDKCPLIGQSFKVTDALCGTKLQGTFMYAHHHYLLQKSMKRSEKSSLWNWAEYSKQQRSGKAVLHKHT
jgi:hypothetical protein